MRDAKTPAATSGAHRRAATERLQQAITTINTMFDRCDELATARQRLMAVKPLGAGDDPLLDAETLLVHAERLHHALLDVRAAALNAAEHRTRGELAADIGTKTASLFPRSTRPGVPATMLAPTAAGDHATPTSADDAAG